MWTHTVIEIYCKPLTGEFPKEGEPADWIERGQVMWCQGEDETVIYFYPLHRILWIKLKKVAEMVHSWVYNNLYANKRFPWGRAWHRRAEKWWDESGIEILDDDEYDDLIRVVFGDEEVEEEVDPVG